MDSPLRHADPDNLVLPFRVEGAGSSGRLTRLGASLDEILARHAYPEPVSRLLGEALLLAAMLGSTVKSRQATDYDEQGELADGRGERFILQTQTDGVVSMIVADWRSPGVLRGYARFDAERLAALAPKEQQDTARLLGKGHLAMTIDRGGDTERYQGIVALDNDSLTAAADRYFAQSEQLPTLIRMAVGRHFAGNGASAWHWRGGALMVQKLTPVGGYRPGSGGDMQREQDGDGDPGEAHGTGESARHGQAGSGEGAGHAAAAGRPGHADDDAEDGWRRTAILAGSLKDDELIDPLIAAEELLLRLFHEDGVRVFASSSMAAGCSCSQQRVTQMLAGFAAAERADMAEADGRIHITCEFCNRSYAVSPEEVGEGV